MSFTLEKIVPWGRSLSEYVAMFNLSDADLQNRILGCGDGPASFNALLTAQGGHVVSADPLYRFSAPDIRKRIDETSAEVVAQTRRNMHEFLWTAISSVDELAHVRMTAMEKFLSDYTQGTTEGRYVDAELPLLPFADSTFDLAVCSHLLFLYSEQLSDEFHLSSIEELCRVANEVRIFPLLELGSRKSRHVEWVTSNLRERGHSVSIVRVPYEFQKGGNEMMVVRHVEQAIAADRVKSSAG